MSGEYTLTPNLQLFKPEYGLDAEQWGFHWNDNADRLDQALGGSANGPFLALAGGSMAGAVALFAGSTAPTPTAGDNSTALATTAFVHGESVPLNGATPMTGPLTTPSITLTGSGSVLTAPNGLHITSDFHSSGIPGFLNDKPMIFGRTVTNVADFADFRFERTTTFTGGAGNISANVRVLGNYGAGDASENWNLVSSANSIGAGFTVGAFINATRNPTGTGGIIGAVINGTDATGNLNSLVSGVVGLEVDIEAQGVDTGGNITMWGGIGTRVILNVQAVRHNSAINTPVTEFAAGVWFTTTTIPPASGDTFTTYLSLIGCGTGTRAYQGLDTRSVVVPTGYTDPFATVRMLAGQAIDFNGGPALKSNAGSYLQYITTGTPRLRYFSAGNEIWSVADSGVMISGGLNLTDQIATGPTDLTKHIDLFSGLLGFAVTAGGTLNYQSLGPHKFYSSTTLEATVDATGISSGAAVFVNGPTGAMWSSGAVVPNHTAPVGSLFSRTNGAVGSTLYVSRGAGTWAAVAGV